MNSKYYAKILKSQGDELNEYDNNIPPEKLMEIFPSDNIVYVNNIPPEDMIERYRNQWSEDNQSDIRLVYVGSIPIAGYSSSERIEFIEASTHELLKEKYHRERLIYINSVTPKLLEMMSPRERYEIKSKLISRIETLDEIDLPLLANTAFPFFTIQLALEFESIGINTFSSVHGSISNSRLSNFVFSFGTELTDQSLNKLKTFQRCFRAAVLNLDERNCQEEWGKIRLPLSLEPSWSLPRNEAGCLELFQNYIGRPTTKFLSVAGHPISVHPNAKTTHSSLSGSIRSSDISGIPDLLYYKNDVPLVAVEVKGPGFSKLVENGIDESSMAFKSIIRQVGRYLVSSNTTRVIITNFHHSLFIEIDEAKLSQLKESTDKQAEVEIPVRYRLLTLSSSDITVQAAFLAWLFFESAEEEKLHAKRQEETVSTFLKVVKKETEQKGESHSAGKEEILAREIRANSNINPQKSNSHIEGECESWTGFEVLQGQGHRSHVYKFQVDLLCKFFPYFNEVLTGLNQDDSVVMKLFIPDVVARLDGWPNPTLKEINICIQDFLKEASCYESIAKHNAIAEEKIHTPTLYYYGAFRMNVQDSDPIEGYYLLLSYIEEDETNITKSMVENGCRQLEMMGDIGIQHHDIATRNCKVADGNIVFLDFSHAKNRESKYDNSDDIHDLKYIYEYDKLEESDDDNYSAISSAPFSEVQFPSTAGTEPTKPDSK